MIFSLRIVLLVIFVPVCWSATFRINCEGNEKCIERQMHPEILTVREKSPDDNSEFWTQNGTEFVRKQTARSFNKNKAKNIIFFIGDGMSLSTLAATRVFLGGEEKFLEFEKFPGVGLAKTYCLNRQVPDSASTATAYLTGVKGNYGTIGVNGNVARRNCTAMGIEDFHTDSIAKWAMDDGKDAGLVTTTRVTHASPAGVYAHTADRDWESDGDVTEKCDKVKLKDIADQLVNGKVGMRLKVILGGGRREFLPKGENDGIREDKRDLVKEWMKNGKGNRTYIVDRDGLLRVMPEKTDALLGLFHTTHMLYHLEAIEKCQQTKQPSLAEMTKTAIEILQKNENGYFLFVEGGKIDMAHHAVRPKTALDETAEFSKAVEQAVQMTDTEDTLIVISSDHSHTMSYGGYSKRKTDILGVSQWLSDVDDKAYLTLSYANGEAFDIHFNKTINQRKDPSTMKTSEDKFQFPSTTPLNTETHGGEDVAVFASGPWWHLFTGTYEQSTLPHLMAFAACIGDGLTACQLK